MYYRVRYLYDLITKTNSRFTLLCKQGLQVIENLNFFLFFSFFHLHLTEPDPTTWVIFSAMDLFTLTLIIFLWAELMCWRNQLSCACSDLPEGSLQEELINTQLLTAKGVLAIRQRVQLLEQCALRAFTLCTCFRLLSLSSAWSFQPVICCEVLLSGRSGHVWKPECSLVSASVLLPTVGAIKVNTMGGLLTHLVSQGSLPEAFTAGLCVWLQRGAVDLKKKKPGAVEFTQCGKRSLIFQAHWETSHRFLPKFLHGCTSPACPSGSDLSVPRFGIFFPPEVSFWGLSALVTASLEKCSQLHPVNYFNLLTIVQANCDLLWHLVHNKALCIPTLFLVEQSAAKMLLCFIVQQLLDG